VELLKSNIDNKISSLPIGVWRYIA